MQPVLRLIEDRRRVRLEGRVVDLLAAIRRQAVHHQRTRLRHLQQLGVDLITRQITQPLRRLGLLAHRHPHIRVEQVRTRRRRGEVFVADDFPARRKIKMPRQHRTRAGRKKMRRARTLKKRLVRLIRPGRGDAQLEAQLRRRKHPRPRDVARPVADERHHLPANRPAAFLERENVRQNLARMLIIGERVDRREARKRGELLDIPLRERADHRAVDHPPEHARGVLDRLAAAELDVVRTEEQRVPAQLANADLERHPRARG